MFLYSSTLHSHHKQKSEPTTHEEKNRPFLLNSLNLAVNVLGWSSRRHLSLSLTVVTNLSNGIYQEFDLSQNLLLYIDLTPAITPVNYFSQWTKILGLPFLTQGPFELISTI